MSHACFSSFLTRTQNNYNKVAIRPCDDYIYACGADGDGLITYPFAWIIDGVGYEIGVSWFFFAMVAALCLIFFIFFSYSFLLVDYNPPFSLGTAKQPECT